MSISRNAVPSRAHLFACSVSLLLLAAPAALAAQQTMSGEGVYGTRNFAAETTELPDGRTLTVNRFHQVTFAADKSHALHDLAGECVGQLLASSDGSPLTGSGFCYQRNVEGDGVSWWWRQDSGGTADCPNICGTFGFVDGFGKFEGISGEGTWQVTAGFEDGGLGAWQMP